MHCYLCSIEYRIHQHTLCSSPNLSHFLSVCFFSTWMVQVNLFCHLNWHGNFLQAFLFQLVSPASFHPKMTREILSKCKSSIVMFPQKSFFCKNIVQEFESHGDTDFHVHTHSIVWKYGNQRKQDLKLQPDGDPPTQVSKYRQGVNEGCSPEMEETLPEFGRRMLWRWMLGLNQPREDTGHDVRTFPDQVT